MNIFSRVIIFFSGLIFVGVGIFLIIHCSEKINLFRKHKQQRIGEIKPGKKVFISGYIGQHKKLIKSPITNKPCAAWEVYVYTSSSTKSKVGYRKVILLYLSSDQSLTLTDRVNKIDIFPEKTSSFTMFLGRMLESVFQISKSPNFMDHQNFLSEFSDPQTLKFLRLNNFNQLNYLGLRRQLTVVEKILIPGDKLYVWGEAMRHENKTVINAKLISDTMKWQILILIMLLFIGLIILVVGLGMCQKLFIY
ncbi:MAG: hypothetical protein EAZ76_04295 [Nostocales cyanobacterium]|nr:MAG: hypothetical protein EAZ87_13040 [Nostocales cyanobacterium]TAF18758.1 MAG: hypothetical protein EAZ76_04295 [Nostocales cyanobacterium]